jgi:hypothetical protein
MRPVGQDSMTDPPFDNPYAPPEAPLERPEPAPSSDEPPTTDAEALRLAGLRVERYARAIGVASFASSVSVLTGVVFGVLWTRLYLEPSAWERVPYIEKVTWITRAFVVPPLMIGLHIALGFAFRKLEPWARRWQIGLSSAVLGAFVINRVFTPTYISDLLAIRILGFGVAHIVILNVLTGSKAAIIFSEEYHQAIEATPQIPRRIGPALMTAAILGGIFAGTGDDSVALTIGRHFATRLMGAHPEP